MSETTLFEHRSVKPFPGTELNLFDFVSPQLNNLGAEFFTLGSGQVACLSSKSVEAAIVICSGRVTVSSDQGQQLLSRSSVFSQTMTAVFFSNLDAVTIEAEADSRFIICCARVDADTPAVFDYLGEEQLVQREVGEGCYQRRVDTLLGSDYPASQLLFGETFNQPGKWSTFPLHKHDQHVPGEQSLHEEIFLFSVEPELGFGFQRVFTDDSSIDESSAVFDGTKTLIPKGYHPVSALPQTQLQYFWVLSGDERELRLKETLIEP